MLQKPFNLSALSRVTAEAEGLLPLAQWSSRRPKRFPDNPGLVTMGKRAKSVQLVSELPAFSNWVACDKCNKWRRVAQEPAGDKWYCSDNLDTEHNACSVPGEVSDEATSLLAYAAHAASTAGVSEAAPCRKRRRCEHGRQRSKCKECGGASICQHGRRRSR